MAPPTCTSNESNCPTARLSPASHRTPGHLKRLSFLSEAKACPERRRRESPLFAPPHYPTLSRCTPEGPPQKSCGLLSPPAIVVRPRGAQRNGPRHNVSSGEQT